MSFGRISKARQALRMTSGTTDRRWPRSLAASLVLHCVVIYAIALPQKAVIVRPTSMRWGAGGTSTRLVFYPRSGAGQSAIAPKREMKRLYLPREVAHLRPAPPQQDVPFVRQSPATAAPQPDTVRAGSPLGSLADGPLEGHDVRPALPLVFPDPSVSRDDLPQGVTGDVVVEVTIDAQGNVIETRVLKAFGYGIDDKVLAVLRNWRFRPATLDGAPVPSQQDVHFHFPS